jgi:ABC-2 type transport system permease protein
VRAAVVRYAKTAQVAGASQIGESPLFLLDYLLRFLRVAVLLALWRTLLAGKGSVSGMTLETLLTYTLVAELFAEQLSARSGLEEALWDGSIGMRLLQPLPMVGIFTAEMIGRWGTSFLLFSAPLLMLSPLLGVDPLPASLAAAGWFALSLPLAVAIGLAIDFIFAALLLRLEISMWLLGHLRTAARTLLSGALVPLALLPWGLDRVFAWLPFASMAAAPLSIYTGIGDPPRLLLLQAAWALLLWPIAQAVWRSSREKLVSHGG